MKCFKFIAKYFKKNKYCIENVVDAFKGNTAEGSSLFVFLRMRAEKLYQLKRIRSGEIMDCTLKSFMQFRNGIDLDFSKVTADLLEQYEACLKSRGITRNTSSFYMRNLRSAYKLAVQENLTVDKQPFRNVYTGIDKTKKRAISILDICKIKSIDLSNHPALDFP